MSTINSIKQSVDKRIRIKVKPNTVSTGDVADNIDLVADEVRSRGFIKTTTTGGLASISGNNTKYAIVQNFGLFEYSPGGVADNVDIFPAEGSGTWNLVATFSADNVDKLTKSADFEYNLAGFKIEEISIKPSINQTIKVGYTNGSEEVLMQDTISGGDRKSIKMSIYSDEHASIFFSGLTASTEISIYKRKL